MTNEEKAGQISGRTLGFKDGKTQDVFEACMEMAEWKDEQPISELNGWHTEEPAEDGWYLVDTPDFPKNCHCIVAEWDNDARRFYSESSDFPIEFKKWKLIEKR